VLVSVTSSAWGTRASSGMLVGPEQQAIVAVARSDEEGSWPFGARK